MRTVTLLVAVVAMLGMEAPPAEARDRGFGFPAVLGAPRPEAAAAPP